MALVLMIACANVAGVLLARGMTSLLVSLLPALPFPIDVSLALDGRVILFAAGLALMAALLSGLVPALQASKADVVSALKNDSPCARSVPTSWSWCCGKGCGSPASGARSAWRSWRE